MSELTIAVLSEAWHKFGGFTGKEPEVSRWVQKRIQEIRSGQGATTVAHPTLPRSFERSWYETDDREPGQEG